MKKQKGGTPDLRDKLARDMASEVAAICKSQGHSPSNAFVQKHVDVTIDRYIEDWYEVSLEALDLLEGAADFVTDDEIDDPEVIKEVKLRIIKSLYGDRPADIHESIAQSVIQNIAGDPGEVGEAGGPIVDPVQDPLSGKPVKTIGKSKSSTKAKTKAATVKKKAAPKTSKNKT